jgi:hypothetical protein
VSVRLFDRSAALDTADRGVAALSVEKFAESRGYRRSTSCNVDNARHQADAPLRLKRLDVESIEMMHGVVR